jgi:hypothetical protein
MLLRCAIDFVNILLRVMLHIMNSSFEDGCSNILFYTQQTLLHILCSHNSGRALLGIDPEMFDGRPLSKPAIHEQDVPQIRVLGRFLRRESSSDHFVTIISLCRVARHRQICTKIARVVDSNDTGQRGTDGTWLR